MESNFSLEKSVPSVKLSVEALPESKIQEILLDGRETYHRPLTMSENLCKMATKIDFLAEEEGRSDEEEEEEDKSKKSFQNQQWPWEGIRNHLRQALTEMNVLHDVLTITQNKGPPQKEGVQPVEGGKYMMFDYAPKESPPSKLGLMIPAKKKGLNAAADILLTGERRLRTAGDESSPEMGFHLQLLKLRKYWRVRRVGSKLLGDLSYRTAGSDFWHSGNFEVIKKTSADDDDKLTEPYLAHMQYLPVKIQSAFKVVVGADLKNSATIRVSIRKLDNPVQEATTVNITEMGGLVSTSDPEWHKTLSSAQNVLFCRELFNLLAKEAIQLKTSCTLTPVLVVGNKITTNIFPDTEMAIELIFSSLQNSTAQPIAKPDHKSADGDIFSLKFAAMKLLFNHYKDQLQIPAPHPTSATFGLTKVQRKAPTRPIILSQLQAISEKEETSLIERLISMAKHWELKHRVCDVVDSLGNAIQDPYIQAYWSKAGNGNETCVRIVIMSAGYEACNRTPVELVVCSDLIKAVQKDGRVITLSSNLHHIRDYLLSLICTHQLHSIQEICLVLGWSILHFSLHAGVGPRSALGNVGSVMAVSPAGNCTISVRCWLERDNKVAKGSERVRYEVYAQNARMDTDDSALLPQRSHTQWLNPEQNAVQDPKWFLLGGEWREIDWQKLYGKHFVQKLESLLTFLKTDNR